MSTQSNEDRSRFIERSGDLLDEHGLPHMAGRVVGALLICSPPYMAHDELAEWLQASRGSISMSTQMLLRMGVVERISLPGHRRHYYRLNENLWNEFFLPSREQIQKHIDLCEQGLALLEEEPVDVKQRLIEMLVCMEFILEQLPEMLDRWRIRRPKLMTRRLEKLSSRSEE
jgi:DNA-binding transcriptional regulator GbsR (MarR family)